MEVSDWAERFRSGFDVATDYRNHIHKEAVR
jgi:hypothetical protein